MSALSSALFSAFFDDLVGHFFGGLEGLSAMDQLVYYVPPGLLDGGRARVLMERWREAPASSTWALVFAESAAECQGSDCLDPVLRGWEKSDVDHPLRTVWFFDPDESLLPEFPEPSPDGAFGAAEIFCEPPVPEPAGVRAEAVQISEQLLLGFV